MPYFLKRQNFFTRLVALDRRQVFDSRSLPLSYTSTAFSVPVFTPLLFFGVVLDGVIIEL
jgi:hypothetical protein